METLLALRYYGTDYRLSSMLERVKCSTVAVVYFVIPSTDTVLLSTRASSTEFVDARSSAAHAIAARLQARHPEVTGAGLMRSCSGLQNRGKINVFTDLWRGSRLPGGRRRRRRARIPGSKCCRMVYKRLSTCRPTLLLTASPKCRQTGDAD